MTATASARDRNGRWTDAALAAVRPVLRFGTRIEPDALPEDQAIGVCSGLGSIVYGLAWISRLLGDGRCLETATRLARKIRHNIESNGTFDIVDGSAGAILGLLAAYEATGDQEILQTAIACGDHLVTNRIAAQDGAGWPAPHGQLLVGFAHGAAGIAYALWRLSQKTGIDRFRDAAADGYRFVRAAFVPAQRNWPIVAHSSSEAGLSKTGMIAWCHGAPGIALACAAALDLFPDARMVAQVTAALETTAGGRPNQADHLCCGNFGRVEALLTVGLAFNRPDAIGAAHDLTSRIAARARQNGHFRPSSSGFEYRVFDPGFFRGLSGIGYQLLRLAAPSVLPSVLSFEPPPNGGRVD